MIQADICFRYPFRYNVRLCGYHRPSEAAQSTWMNPVDALRFEHYGKPAHGGYQFIGSPFKLNCFLCLQWTIVIVTIRAVKITPTTS